MTPSSDNLAVYTALLNKEKKLAVVGLGYVGLPIALEFARYFSVVGFDINAERVSQLQQGIDPDKELTFEDFTNRDIKFTTQIADIRDAVFYVVAVPTPVDEHNVPDLKALLGASRSVGSVLERGDYVVYESTVYPGCTEEDCVPVLESESGLNRETEFKMGYSPERLNPGDKEHGLTKVVKVVSGCDKDSLDNIAAVYGQVITAGIHKASCIKVAEAAKVIENTQRDLNIALMNELAIIFDKLDINTHEVLEAASTKWNFLSFNPGLVGGHCIGVDPYYLTYKANQLGYQPEVILSGRRINDAMGSYIARRVVQLLIKAGKNVAKCKVLVMGVTFKENVSDIRNSKVVDLVRELQSFSVQVDLTDPHASSEELDKEYGLQLLNAPNGNSYDAIVVAVKHREYIELPESHFTSLANQDALFVDIKGIYNQQIQQLQYWTL